MILLSFASLLLLSFHNVLARSEPSSGLYVTSLRSKWSKGQNDVPGLSILTFLFPGYGIAIDHIQIRLYIPTDFCAYCVHPSNLWYTSCTLQTTNRFCVDNSLVEKIGN